MLLLEITLLIMIAGTIVSYAAGSNPPSDGVRYNSTTVKAALDDLYEKVGNAGCSSWSTRTPDTSMIAVGGKRTYLSGIYPSNFTVSCENKICPSCPSGTNISLSNNDFKAEGTYTSATTINISKPNNFGSSYTLIVFMAKDSRHSSTFSVSNATQQGSFETTTSVNSYYRHYIKVYKVSGQNPTITFSPNQSSTGLSYLLINGTFSSVSLEGGVNSNTTNTYKNSTTSNKIVVNCIQSDYRGEPALHEDSYGVFRNYAYVNRNTKHNTYYSEVFTVYEVVPNGYLHVTNSSASDNSTERYKASNQYPRFLVFTK